MKEHRHKVGDKVRRIANSNLPNLFGIKGHVYTVSAVTHNLIVQDMMIRLEELPTKFVMAVNFEPVSNELFSNELFEL